VQGKVKKYSIYFVIGAIFMLLSSLWSATQYICWNKELQFCHPVLILENNPAQVEQVVPSAVGQSV